LLQWEGAAHPAARGKQHVVVAPTVVARAWGTA
jgi:hypothetical protein